MLSYCMLLNIKNIECSLLIYVPFKKEKLNWKALFCTGKREIACCMIIDFFNVQAFDPLPLMFKGRFPSPISNFESCLSYHSPSQTSSQFDYFLSNFEKLFDDVVQIFQCLVKIMVVWWLNHNWRYYIRFFEIYSWFPSTDF